jgi:hypothetical protein
MPRTIKTTVYQFDELSNEAKENARQWWREGASQDDWWDFDDFVSVGEILGIQFAQNPVQLMNGQRRYEPKIYFSGFSSQGDGACFEGDYSYSHGAVEKIKGYAPMDEELHRIARDLQAVQRRYFYGLQASVVHRGRDYHALSTDINVSHVNDIELPESVCEDIAESLRDFMNWMYRQLEREWEYQNSDEVVDENIRINEYEFTEEGKRA